MKSLHSRTHGVLVVLLVVGLGCNSKNDGTSVGAGGGGGTSGSGGGAGAGAGGAGGTAGASGAGGTAGTGGGAGAGGGAAAGGAGGTSAAVGCPVNPSACTDGMDNDKDGLVDGNDPECSGTCDNDEGSFATGISGDNIDACKQDCFFDGNSGMGDDGCEWNFKCDPKSPGAHATKACPYDPNFKNCPEKQSDTCIKSCQRVTPNGCDCFGCCAVPFGNQTVTVMLTSTCKGGSLGDEKACPRCTQQTSCVNTCGKCEVCVGKPAPDPGCVIGPAPTDGGVPVDASTADADAQVPGADASVPPPAETPCGSGVTYCGPGGATCGGGSICLTGCCLIP